MTEDVRHTLEEAIALKKRLADERETDAPKHWEMIFLVGTYHQAVDFLNYAPAQGAGEAIILDLSNETGVATLIYYLA